jgi:hypothetical protein
MIKHSGLCLGIATLACSACDASGRDVHPALDAPANACTIDGPVTVQGTVSVAGPVQVTGTVDVQQPVRLVSADSDPARHVRANISIGTNAAPAAPGPFFFTDISWANIGTAPSVEMFESASSDCQILAGDVLDVLFTSPQSGMRYFVAADRWLCAFGHGVFRINVAGFRPY